MDSHHQHRMRKPLPSPHSLSIRVKSYSGPVTTMYDLPMMKSHAGQVLTLPTGTNNILLRTGRAKRCWFAKIYIISGTYTTRRASQADPTLRQGSSVSIGEECSSVESKRSYTMAFDVSRSMMSNNVLDDDKFQTRRLQGLAMYVFLVKRYCGAIGCWLPGQDVQG